MSNVREFGAKGDGKTDDSAALSHAIQQGDGHLVFPRGDYLISRPLYVPLERHGRICIDGSGGTAKLIMAGPGPALHLVGTHKSNALPANISGAVWKTERLPTVQGLEIEGRHAQADGIRVEGAMQPTLLGLLVRQCRHGIHLTSRDRNVLIGNCHIYDNSGAGVFLDHINLHQINITGSHISYCKQSAIRVEGGEIRNLQICGNDIEYSHDPMAAAAADILLDSREGTIREGAIVGNTIQAKQSPGGANIRLIGGGQGKRAAVGMFAITGNLIGDQLTCIHLQSCRGVTVSANCLYGGAQHAIWAEDAEHLVFGPNSLDHNSDYKGKTTDRILLRGCRDVAITGLILQHTFGPLEEPPASLEIDNCSNISLTGCQLLGARNRGVLVRGSSLVRIADCTIRPQADDQTFRAAVSIDDKSRHVMVVNNFLAKGSDGDLVLPQGSGTASGNVTV
jgi:parallel beta-helix repeat protein